MQLQQTAPTNGRPRSAPAPRSELDRLRATCRRQARAIDTLRHAVCSLRSGAAALKAENADLRVECVRLGRHRSAAARGDGALDARQSLDVRLPMDLRAEGAARIVVAQCLRERVAAPVLESAQLLVSELVANSVRHSGASAADGVIVRVQLTYDAFWLEVEDCGSRGVIAPRPPDPQDGGGLA
jgi:hypothetical protein